MKLSFMTWVCPDWNVKQIIEGAKKYNYDGVEIRVQTDHAHGLDIESDATARADFRKAFEDAGVEISCIATSLKFSNPDESVRQENIDLLRRYIELAHDVGSPNIRVFGGAEGKGEPTGIIKTVAEALADVCREASDAGVYVCLETHDYFSHSKYVARAVQMANCPNIRALWDVLHPVRHLETVDEAYANLRGLVQHLHLHDAKHDEARNRIQLCPLGEGMVDHKRAMELLKADGFEGHFAVELMRVNPDEVLPQYSRKWHEYLAELQ